MQITPAVNYSPLCKPRENRPFGFPVTGQPKQQLLACLLLIKPKAQEPPRHRFPGLNLQRRMRTCALCVLLSALPTTSWVRAPAPTVQPRGHPGAHGCWLLRAKPACPGSTLLCAIVQDCTPAAVCLSVVNNNQ